jgi:hypothetical protein
MRRAVCRPDRSVFFLDVHVGGRDLSRIANRVIVAVQFFRETVFLAFSVVLVVLLTAFKHAILTGVVMSGNLLGVVPGM